MKKKTEPERESGKAEDDKKDTQTMVTYSFIVIVTMMMMTMMGVREGKLWGFNAEGWMDGWVNVKVAGAVDIGKALKRMRWKWVGKEEGSS